MIEHTDGAILATRAQRAKEAARPPEPWCSECGADGPPHEVGCPMVAEFVAAMCELAKE